MGKGSCPRCGDSVMEEKFPQGEAASRSSWSTVASSGEVKPCTELGSGKESSILSRPVPHYHPSERQQLQLVLLLAEFCHLPEKPCPFSLV